ncbi:MAG: sulfotransferase family protein [Acidimicrobiales bacterium]
MARPNFVIAGAARSGTTALARALGAHPDVFFTEPKEVHFFAHVDAPRRYLGPGDDAAINHPMVSDPAAFSALFDGAAEPLLGEGSVSTLYAPDVAIPALRAHADPDLKVIAVLRSPAERAYSAFLYLRSRGHETAERFVDGLDAEAERIDAGWHHMWHYRGMSRYDQQLPAFADAFGSRLLVVDFDDLESAPAATLSNVADFLGLDPTVPVTMAADVNRGGEPRSAAWSAVVNRVRTTPALNRLARTVVPPQVRTQLRSRNLARPDADPEVMAALRAELVPATEAVERVLGRSLPRWRGE